MIIFRVISQLTLKNTRIPPKINKNAPKCFFSPKKYKNLPKNKQIINILFSTLYNYTVAYNRKTVHSDHVKHLHVSSVAKPKLFIFGSGFGSLCIVVLQLL